eukprot:3847037-Prymnesium_polylepis.1
MVLTTSRAGQSCERSAEAITESQLAWHLRAWALARVNHARDGEVEYSRQCATHASRLVGWDAASCRARCASKLHDHAHRLAPCLQCVQVLTQVGPS